MNAMDIVLTAGRVSVRSFDATRSWRTIVVTLIVGPVLQVVYLLGMSGSPAPGPERARIAIAAVLLSVAVAALESTAVALATSRYDGALVHVMMAPVRSGLVWLGQVLAATLIAFVAGVASAFFSAVLLGATGIAMPFLQVIAAIAVTALACSGFGFALGAFSLLLRDSLIVTSLVASLMVVACGVIVPIDSYWPPVQVVAFFIPLTASIQAVEHVLSGDSARAGIMLGTCLLTGAAWAVLGSVAWSVASRFSRRYGTLEIL